MFEIKLILRIESISTNGTVEAKVLLSVIMNTESVSQAQPRENGIKFPRGLRCEKKDALAQNSLGGCQPI